MQGEIAGCVSDFRRTAIEAGTIYEKDGLSSSFALS